MLGPMMLPPVSLPTAKATNPAAVAAPGPALDPDDPSSSSHGFMVWPPNQISFQRQGTHTQLGDKYGARVVKTLHHRGIRAGHPISVRLSAIRCQDAGSIQEVFGAPRNPVQRPSILTGGNFFVGPLGLRQRQLARQRDHTVQFGIEPLQPRQVDLSEPLRGKFALLDPARQVSHRSEGDIRIAFGQRTRIYAAADESVAIGTCRLTGEYRVPTRPGRHSWFQRHLSRASSTLVERRHRVSPVASRESSVRGTQIHLHQLFCFSEGGCRNLRSHGWRGAESWRSAGGQFAGCMFLVAARGGGAQQTD
jgi:hypothetical protein